MDIPITNPQTGDIVLDTDVTLLTLTEYDSFKDKYPALLSIVDILGLFALAEAIVLNQRILSEHVNDGHLARFETITELSKREVLYGIEPILAYGENQPGEFDKAAWASLEPLAQEISGWPGADFTLSASVRRARWCNKRNLDHLPWPIFGALPAAAGGAHRGILRQTYKRVSDDLQERIQTLRGAGSPIPIYIPPIPAIVLERCAGKAPRFVHEAIALREEFADSRQKIVKYQKVISGENYSLGELWQAYSDSVSDVIRELDRLKFMRTDSRLVLEMWEAVGETKIGRQDPSPEFQLNLNLGALLSKGLQWFSARRVKARARLLFDVYEKTLQIRNYGNLIADVFKVDESKFSRDALIVEKIGRLVDQLAAVDRENQLGLPASTPTVLRGNILKQAGLK